MPRVKIKSYDRKKNRTHDAARTCTLHTFTLCSIAPVQTNSERSIFEFNTLSEAKYDSLICCCTKDTCGVSCCNRCTQHDDNLPTLRRRSQLQMCAASFLRRRPARHLTLEMYILRIRQWFCECFATSICLRIVFTSASLYQQTLQRVYECITLEKGSKNFKL